MAPFYFCFPDRTTTARALKLIAMMSADESWQDSNLDVIGLSRRPNGTQRTGYFVNLMAEEIHPALVQFQKFPVTPFRAFAGWSPEEIAARAQLTG